ncbi:MAG: hypothetical protein V3U60_16870 [Gammaproteobacteria bacterium]
MASENRIPLTLFLLRISVFLVMFMWCIDKLMNPAHAAIIFEKFYFMAGLSNTVLYIMGIAELVILIGFVTGFKKRLTYGLVLLFHGVSTLASFGGYLAPFEGPNLLFFAAWPMLAAAFALYYLRDLDTLWAIDARAESISSTI